MSTEHTERLYCRKYVESLERDREEIKTIKHILDKAGQAIGNEHVNYSQADRVANLVKIKEYFYSKILADRGAEMPRKPRRQASRWSVRPPRVMFHSRTYECTECKYINGAHAEWCACGRNWTPDSIKKIIWPDMFRYPEKDLTAETTCIRYDC